jgi:hypothetical protein
MLSRGVLFAVLCAPIAAFGGTVVGKVEMPAPPERPPIQTKGFLDRMPNPISPVKPVATTPYMVVVLEADDKPPSPGPVSWDLVGDSFAKPVLVAPVGAEVVIKNTAKQPRTLDAVEDGKLVPGGPLNPNGTKSFRLPQAGKIYTIGDRDAPYLKGVIAVVNTSYIASVDAAGKFEVTDIPPGGYKLRLFYKDHWTDVSQTVDVPAKGKVEPTVKLTAWADAKASK